MASLAILTSSFRGDAHLFRELHRSVLRCTDDDVIHHVAVPDRDVDLFASIGSPRLRVIGASTLLPRHFVSTCEAVGALRRVPVVGRSVPPVQAVNLRHPWPPVRGWVVQQLLKLEAVPRLAADVVVLADSDVVFFRHLSSDDFVRDGSVRFYRGADPLTPDLIRHATWHRVSRQLLGLPEQADDTDYISAFMAWDPRVVRKVQQRVEEVTGGPWIDAVARELHFSEFMLYGCYVDHLGTSQERSFASTDPRCLSYWGTAPLDDRTAEEFVAEVEPSDLAVLIQSASHTPAHIRRRVVGSLTASALR